MYNIAFNKQTVISDGIPPPRFLVFSKLNNFQTIKNVYSFSDWLHWGKR